MKYAVLGTAAACLLSSQASAATLDDVLAELRRLRQENAAMRSEVASLRREVTPSRRESGGAQRTDLREPVVSARDAAPRAAMAAAGLILQRPVYGPYDWSGFHVGVHGGYGAGETEWGPLKLRNGPNIRDLGDRSLGLDTTGGLAGLQAGLDFQTGRLVLGTEASLSYAGIQDSSSADVTTVLGTNLIEEVTTNINWVGTVTGRIGYAFDNVMVYAKGGAAAAGLDHTLAFHALGSRSESESENRFGWTVGLGAEFAFWRNWSATAEYNYVDLGSKQITFEASDLFIANDIQTNLHVLKVGLNYRFGTPY